MLLTSITYRSIHCLAVIITRIIGLLLFLVLRVQIEGEKAEFCIFLSHTLLPMHQDNKPRIAMNSQLKGIHIKMSTPEVTFEELCNTI